MINNYILIFTCIFLNYISIMLLYKKYKEDKIHFILPDLFFFITSVIAEICLEAMGYNFEILGGYVCSILLIKLIYNEKLKEAFYYYLCIIVFMQVSKLIIMTPIFILLHLGFKIENIVINFIDITGIFIFTVISIKLLPLKIYYDKCKKILERANFLIINLISFVLILKLTAFYEFNFFKKYFFIFLVIFALFISISILFARYSVRIKDQEIQIKTYLKYNPIILELTDDIKSRQHDFKNHLNTIYGIIQTTEEKELKQNLEKYITTLNDSLKTADDMIVINNRLVAAIIYIKSSYAKSESIKFNYDIDCDLKEVKLKDYELSEILNNLLDNSFTAVKNEEKEHRKVNLKLFSNEQYFCIHIENGGLTIKPNEIDKIFNKGFSTKTERNHGYGLYNVKKIVQAYDGKIELNAKGRVLEMALYFPNSAIRTTEINMPKKCDSKYYLKN